MRPVQSGVSIPCAVCLLPGGRSLALHKRGPENHLGWEHLGEGKVPESLKGLSSLFRDLSQQTWGPPSITGHCTCLAPPPTVPPQAPSPHTQEEAVPSNRGKTAVAPRHCRHVPAVRLGFGGARERERREIHSTVKNENIVYPLTPAPTFLVCQQRPQRGASVHQALQFLSLEGKGASCGHGGCEDTAAGAGVLMNSYSPWTLSYGTA